MKIPRYAATELRAFAAQLLVTGGGLEANKAAVVADVLVEAELAGHRTHGLALIPTYVEDLRAGRVARTGQPTVVNECAAGFTWDGARLPGPWLIRAALNRAARHARSHGACTAVVRRSGHAACLGVYAREAAEAGLVAIVAASGTRDGSVVPHGGRDPALTANPIAAGWPTVGSPIVFDFATSAVANGTWRRLRQSGEKLRQSAFIDSNGKPTNDPVAGAAILPLGGLEQGHKGFALGLLVAALSAGLAGEVGPDSEPKSSSIYLQLYDAQAFGGAEAFSCCTGNLAEACRRSPARPGSAGVRLPGAESARRREAQSREGVELWPHVLVDLRSLAERYGVEFFDRRSAKGR